MPTSLEPLFAEFDRCWRSGTGTAPRLEEYVTRVEAGERAELLEELIPIDLEYRWRTYSSAGAQATARLRPQGEVGTANPGNAQAFPSHPAIEDYVRRFPDLGSVEDCSIELIAAEYFARKRWGDRPQVQEYFLRFPGRDAELSEALADVDAELARECGAANRKNGAGRQAALTQMRCPRCRRRIERPGEAGSDVTCPACGDHFTAPEPSAAPFLQLGRYRVDEKLGAGGFGTVWKAWDTELQREVAVKLPRNGRFASAEEEERFLREARAAAGLRHDGIIPIFDAGQHNQTLFIVSDLVRGKNLEEWIAEERLSLRESAEVVAQIAEALDYAHRHGVVHRDLKPANVMLDLEERTMSPTAPGSKRPSGRKSEGREPLRFRPKIMDFGLAKWAGSAVTVTLDGEVFGTPVYMSPEQVRDSHQADARSDVYSLGVILYELLTGETPFRGQAAMVMEQVQREEPRRPRRLDNRIPVDLETICLKCLVKEPAGRYADAQALAEDLRRFLAGEPIVARPAGTAERLWRWARRRPGIASLSAAVAAMILVVVFGSLAFALRLAKEKANAEMAQHRAEASAREARLAQASAEKSQAEAKKEADRAEKARQAAELERRQILKSLEGLTQVVDRQLARLPNSQIPRENILRRTVAELDRIDGQGNDREVREMLMVARILLGDVLQLRGAGEEAHQEYEQAYALGMKLVKTASAGDNIRCNVADACLRLGASYQERGNHAAARRHYLEARQLLEGWLKVSPPHFDVDGRLAVIHSRFGDVLFDRAEWSAAIAEYEKAHERFKVPFAAAPNAYVTDVATTLDRMGKAHLMNNNAEAAESRLRAALDVLNSVKPTDGWNLAQLRLYEEVYGDLGNVLLQQKKRAEARKFYEDELRIAEGLIQLDTGNLRYRRAAALAYLRLADLQLREGQPDAALAGGRKAIQLLRASTLDGRTPYRLKVELGMAYEQLGKFCLYFGDPAARDCLEAARKLRLELVQANPTNWVYRQQLADVCLKMARYYERIHDYAEGARWHETTLEMVQKMKAEKLGPDFTRTIEDIQRSKKFCEDALKAGDDIQVALALPADRAAGLLTARVAILCRRGQAAAALATAEKLAEVAPKDGDGQFNLACALALCAAASAEDDQPKLRTRALEALRRASDAGFKDLGQITTDPDLAEIRKQPGYTELIKALKPAE